MFITKLPNAYNTDASSDEAGSGNTVIYARTTDKYFYPAHKTPYVFVTNFINEGSYVVNNRNTFVNDKCFYFLEQGSNLSINFNKKKQIQTLLILFDEWFIKNAVCQNTASEETLLSHPHEMAGRSFHVPAIPFMMTDKIKTLLAYITADKGLGDDFLQSALLEIVAELCSVNSETKKQVNKLRAVKKATREELFTRLQTAKMFMADNACNTVLLDDIATACCMNSFHLLRTFKQAYNTTPHQYLLQLKLDKAFDLIKYQHYSVTEACYHIGFESVGSFSSLFKRKFSIGPSQLQS